VLAADQLFATLDPTLRRVLLPGNQPVVLADTVGFIRHLPHDLVESFRSTLQETREADLLLHVVDASDPDRDAKMEQVQAVLAEIGADEVPQIEVFNKIDRMEGGVPQLEQAPDGRPLRVSLSAATGEGVGLLVGALADYFGRYRQRQSLRLPPQASRLRARLYDLGAVVDEQMDAGSGDWLLEVELEPHALEQLRRQADFAELLPQG
jgi:GTP-binding protein HflX